MICQFRKYPKKTNMAAILLIKVCMQDKCVQEAEKSTCGNLELLVDQIYKCQ